MMNEIIEGRSKLPLTCNKDWTNLSDIRCPSTRGQADSVQGRAMLHFTQKSEEQHALLYTIRHGPTVTKVPE